MNTPSETNEPLMTQHGPHRVSDEVYQFRLWAPSAASVRLKVAGADPLPMPQVGNGWYELEHPAKVGDEYLFILADGQKVCDPASRLQRGGVHGRSLLVDPLAYEWKCTDWINRPWHEAIIYELHVGVLGGFRAATSSLDRLAELGVTAIELMPIAEFPGERNWGYDGVLPFAPSSVYGSPTDLRTFIDTAHALGMMVLLDVVYNHFGPDGAYLHLYAKTFFDEGVHTPWGAAIDFKKEEVRAFFIENALMWLNEYHFDGLRFDAVHAISPPDFLPELALQIRARSDRPVHLILEHEGNKASLLRGPSANLFDAQWADDWHHCVHVLLTGEAEGYYESFQYPAEQLAKALAEGFVFQGEVSPHHGTARGEPSKDLPFTAFIFCLQNHDQVGNRAFGERLTKLAPSDALAAAIALLLLSPTIPMIFMGEEHASTSPFLFFTDFDGELATAVTNGRRKEFAHFEAFRSEEKQALIPDPNSPATFRMSNPSPSDLDNSPGFDFYKTLLELRRRHVWPGIQGSRSIGSKAISSQAVECSWQLGNDTILAIAVNFSSHPIECSMLKGKQLFTTKPMNDSRTLEPRSLAAFLVTNHE